MNRLNHCAGLAVAAALCSMAVAAAEIRARLYVTPVASNLVEQGLVSAAPSGADAATFTDVPPPGVRFVPNIARATNLPWVDSNGWRFLRGLRRANYAKLPAGSAPLAAAEAFAFNVDAILNPDAADVNELGNMLRFLKPWAEGQPPLPAMANIGVVDSPSPLMGEVLNLMMRRNLLYEVVPRRDSRFDLTVQLGAPDFPIEWANNPYDFAARVREKLGDDRRLVRLYGTSTVLARLTGDTARARLLLLNFASRRRQPAGEQAIRVRVRGRYKPTAFAGYGAAPDAELTDLRNPGDATEFWVPDFSVIAIIDLQRTR